MYLSRCEDWEIMGEPIRFSHLSYDGMWSVVLRSALVTVENLELLFVEGKYVVESGSAVEWKHVVESGPAVELKSVVELKSIVELESVAELDSVVELK